MKMELIQPFINAADAVLAETLQCNTRIGDMTMEEEAYRRKGVAGPPASHDQIHVFGTEVTITSSRGHQPRTCAIWTNGQTIRRIGHSADWPPAVLAPPSRAGAITNPFA